MNDPALPDTLPPPAPDVPKSIFKSKTALAGALVAIAGALGTQFPDADQWIAANANVILLVVGLASIALRKITKDKVVVFGNERGP